MEDRKRMFEGSRRGWMAGRQRERAESDGVGLFLCFFLLCTMHRLRLALACHRLHSSAFGYHDGAAGSPTAREGVASTCQCTSAVV